MIYLSTTQSSEVIIIPQKILNSPTNYYNFNIISADGFYQYQFAPQNWSTSPYYLGFTISVGTPSSLTGSNVTLDLENGEYTYIVSRTTTEYDLVISNNIIDNGILIVLGTSSFPTPYTQSDDDTIKIYNRL